MRAYVIGRRLFLTQLPSLRSNVFTRVRNALFLREKVNYSGCPSGPRGVHCALSGGFVDGAAMSNLSDIKHAIERLGEAYDGVLA